MPTDLDELAARSHRRSGGSPLGLVRNLVIAAFGAIQLILAARIALDLGLLPDVVPRPLVVEWSDAVAAPVQGLARPILDSLGLGIGGGIDPAIIAALVGWSIVEAIVLVVVGRFR